MIQRPGRLFWKFFVLTLLVQISSDLLVDTLRSVLSREDSGRERDSFRAVACRAARAQVAVHLSAARAIRR